MAIYFKEITLVEWFQRMFSRHCQKFLEIKVIEKALCNYEQLSSDLCEIERAINQWSLMHMADEIYEEVLMPFHIIFGRNIDDNCTIDFNQMTTH